MMGYFSHDVKRGVHHGEVILTPLVKQDFFYQQGMFPTNELACSTIKIVELL